MPSITPLRTGVAIVSALPFSMETNPILNFGNQGAERPACHSCGKASLADVHRIYPHPLRGPSYESVLLSCTQCGTKRLHTRPVRNLSELVVT